MDPKVLALANNDILAGIGSRYGTVPQEMHATAGFENLIYEFRRADGDYILRLSHSSRRTPQQILGEVHWINYLSAGGAAVARAICSKGRESGRMCT